MDDLQFTLEDSMLLLSKMYHKILKINLTTDTYTEIKVYNAERKRSRGYEEKISEWLTHFAYSGNVYELDVQNYLDFVNIDSLREKMKEKNCTPSVRYRRLVNGSYRWVVMEFLHAVEYTDDNQVAMLYVRDVNDVYADEFVRMRELEHINHYDLLTGTENLRAYKENCERLTLKNSVTGAMFADLNGLKVINDSFGHDAGNDYIRKFANKLMGNFGDFRCYRLSGDEFVILFTETNKAEAQRRFEAFYEEINSNEIPEASLGFFYPDEYAPVENVIKNAEKNMYDNKRAFYKKHPNYTRSLEKEAREKEVTEVIKCLADAYKNIYMINLEYDTYKMIKHDLHESEAPLDKVDRYSKFNAYICEQYVDKEYFELRRDVGNPENLKKALAKEDSVSVDFVTTYGQWRRTTFRCYERIDDVPVKVILYTSIIDSTRAARLKRRHEIEELYSKKYKKQENVG